MPRHRLQRVPERRHGIVERTDGLDFHKVGDFGDASLADVRALIPDAQIVVGDACETLPATDTGPVAFAHLDVDQYTTHRACINELVPRLQCQLARSKLCLRRGGHTRCCGTLGIVRCER